MHGSRTLLRRHRRGKHTFEINAPNIAEAAANSGAPLPSVARVADPDDRNGRRGAPTPPTPASSADASPNKAPNSDLAAAGDNADDSEFDDEPGIDLSGRHSFGFFGAVTSAISIVPDVRGKSAPAPHDENPHTSDS